MGKNAVAQQFSRVLSQKKSCLRPRFSKNISLRNSFPKERFLLQKQRNNVKKESSTKRIFGLWKRNKELKWKKYPKRIFKIKIFQKSKQLSQKGKAISQTTPKQAKRMPSPWGEGGHEVLGWGGVTEESGFCNQFFSGVKTTLPVLLAELSN